LDEGSRQEPTANATDRARIKRALHWAKIEAKPAFSSSIGEIIGLPKNRRTLNYPTISVVIPCYRSGAYLIHAVESVLHQSGAFDLLEILVVDDNNDDPETIKSIEFARGLSKTRVIPNVRKRGSAGARNSGVECARGKWIAFLDADDWYLPDSLQSRMLAFSTYPDAEWFGGDFLTLERDGRFPQRGRFEGNLDAYHFLKPSYQAERKPIRLTRPIAEFLEQPPTNTIVTLLCKSLFERENGFDESLLKQQDFHLFLRLASTNDFVYVPQPVAVYRLHETNSTRSEILTQEWRIAALRKLAKLPQFETRLASIHTRIFDLQLGNAYLLREQGEFQKAFRAALQGIISRPSSSAAWRCLAAAGLRR